MGAGWVAAAGEVRWTQLWSSFFFPLLLGPALALLFAFALYPALRWLRLRLGVTETSAVAVAGRFAPVLAAPPGLVDGPGPLEITPALARALPFEIAVGAQASIVRRYEGTVVGLNAQHALDIAHYASAGAMSFARGLNDAPKIVALLIGARALGLSSGLWMVAVAMAIGGLLSARRVAQTMSTRITTMNAGQGFTANFVTALLVLGASRLGLPVSTTHVSCGALFGLGAATRQARWDVIAQISLAWVTTLPVAVLCAAGAWLFFSQML